MLGRNSTYGSVVGGLSLVAVALALYLSPIGSPGVHAQDASSSHPGAGAGPPPESDAQAIARARHERQQSAAAGTAPASASTTPDRLIERNVVYVPVAANPGPTTTVPPPTTTTTTTTAPSNVATFTVQTKSELVDAGSDYWGVAITGVPQGTSQLDALDAEIERAPSELTWFEGWDQPYPSQAVETSWQHGALPMITWQSEQTSAGATQSDPTYSLSNIIDGKFDAYIQTFAQAVVAEGLPVVIRLDQEMNGNWFPWSEGVNGNTSGQFVQMWRHVWNIFQAAGANNYVIWLWAPNRVDNLVHLAPMNEYYPGDAYVDWIGLDAYWRSVSTAPTFASIFGKTLADLATVSNKPIFIAETAGIETNPATGASVSSEKVEFTTDLLQGIKADNQIIGFSWFDNVAVDWEDGVPISNDWRIDSDAANLVAFKSGLNAGSFTNGLMPAVASTVQLTVSRPGPS